MIKICNIKSKVGVQAGLALSPAEIERLTARGQSAALGSLESNSYFDNLPNGADCSFENQRGVSMNDVWQHSQAAKKRIMDARSRAAIEKAVKAQPNPELN